VGRRQRRVEKESTVAKSGRREMSLKWILRVRWRADATLGREELSKESESDGQVKVDPGRKSGLSNKHVIGLAELGRARNEGSQVRKKYQNDQARLCLCHQWRQFSTGS
jgi:hypothetical protein